MKRDEELASLLEGLSGDELDYVLDELPPEVIANLMAVFEGQSDRPTDLLATAYRVDESYRERPHLHYVSQQIAEAVRDVERGKSRYLIVSLPPRSGKSYLATQITPAWILQQHPDWHVALTSHDGTLAAQWGRQVRRWVEAGKVPGVAIARDAGAVKEWETTAGGGVLSRSIRESFTGRGAKVLIIDDPHKDFADAHSAVARQQVWEWWLSVAQTRLEPPSLVLVIATRWHEDDLIGRLLSPEHEGDPSEWQVLSLPALAEPGDALGRAPDAPLLSPLFDEDTDEAVRRWEGVKRGVGSYVWSALYQQRPAPAEGSVFDLGTLRYWTTDPAKVVEDGSVQLLDLPSETSGEHWVDSWDLAFKGADTSDFVVGQRWVRRGANRYLVAQRRGRWSFSETVRQMRAWGDESEYASRVAVRLVEDAANGPAIIDHLREELTGLRPVRPRGSKEARARAVSPFIESGNVLLPHPSDPGNEWVADFISELRNFPHDAHDDQVDAMTQALDFLRQPQGGGIANPNARGVVPQRPLQQSSGRYASSAARRIRR